MNKSELQQLYFQFYDQLPEPYRTQAKENWDWKFENITEEVSCIYIAIFNGFSWSNSKEGVMYWHNLYRMLLDSKYIQLPAQDHFYQDVEDDGN